MMQRNQKWQSPPSTKTEVFFLRFRVAAEVVQQKIDQISMILEKRSAEIYSELREFGYDVPSPTVLAQIHDDSPNEVVEPIQEPKPIKPTFTLTNDSHNIVELSDRVSQLIQEYNSQKSQLFESELRYSLAESYLLLGNRSLS